MNIELRFLTSRVAIRVFFLFVIAAIIPVTITGIYSYKYVSNLLVTQKQEQLTSASKSYGMAIYDRILNAEERFNNLVLEIQSQKANDLVDNTDTSILLGSTERLFTGSEIYQIPTNSSKADINHFLNGKSKITITNNGGNLDFYFSKLLENNNKHRILSAKLDSSYIFKNLNTLPGRESACVVMKNKGIFHCTDKKLDPVFKEYLESDVNLSISSNSIFNTDEYISSSWELYLNGKFNTDSWHIFYSSPNDVFSAPITLFAKKFTPILLFSVLLVSFISLNQISRILTPLGKLTEITKFIAKGDFSKRVILKSDDEFQQLGDSFNHMSQELSKQFSDMSAMSELDRNILSTMDLNSAFFPIFNHLTSAFHTNFAGIIAMDSQHADVGYLYSFDKATSKVITKGSLEISQHDEDILFKDTDTYFPIANRDQYAKVDWIEMIDSKIISIVPIRVQEKLIGCIVCGFNTFPEINKPDLIRLENFVDRVAVALSAAKREEKLTYQANYDSLTRLPNRQHLMSRFDNAISMAKHNDTKIAFLFIDLDRFKIINDSQGHATGDKLLVSAADRILASIGRTDTVARYGGDEFAVIISDVSDKKAVAKTAETIIHRLSEAFYIGNYEHIIGASIGISMFPKDGNTWDDLLQKSDIAMYKAKQSGRGKHLFFTDKMHEDILDKAELEADLHHAIERNELFLVYQPQINAKSGDITGAETLIRWNHGTKGAIRPDRFISYAEDNGLIFPIGSWVIRETLKQCEQWQLNHHALPKIAINISAKQLRHENFMAEVEELIEDFDIGLTNIEFEITESLFISDDKYTLDILHRLNKLGISIAIDDFGKGYSSLSYLKKLPVQTLKIDRLFIKDLNRDDDSIEIVNAIIAMGHALNKTVVAEGIETLEQLEILKELNCDRVQGYLVSRPKRASEFYDYSKTAIIQLEKSSSGLKIVS